VSGSSDEDGGFLIALKQKRDRSANEEDAATRSDSSLSNQVDSTTKKEGRMESTHHLSNDIEESKSILIGVLARPVGDLCTRRRQREGGER